MTFLGNLALGSNQEIMTFLVLILSVLLLFYPYFSYFCMRVLIICGDGGIYKSFCSHGCFAALDSDLITVIIVYYIPADTCNDLMSD